MSIIYDALKKIEGKDKTRQPTGKKRVNPVLVFFFAGLVIAVVLSGSQYFKKKSVFMPDKAAKARYAAQKETAASPAFETKWTDNYVLEGVIYDPETPLAIINGKILRKKDKIDDLEVTNITPNSVELFNPKDNASLNLTL